MATPDLASLLKRSETFKALEDYVHNTVKHEFEVSVETLKALVRASIAQSLDVILVEVKTWKPNAETFSDAIEKIQALSLKKARHLLATSSDQQAFRSMRPEIPALDHSQADLILNGREPSMLRELYIQGLSKRNADSVTQNLAREPKTQEFVLEDRFEQMKKWASQE